MTTASSDARQHVEGVFVRSVINQIQNLNIHTIDKEQVKQIFSQVLVDSLPELVKHPAMVEELRHTAYKILSDLLGQDKQIRDTDLAKAARLVWQRSELEVARALAAVVDEASRTVERVFKEKKVIYQSLTFDIEANGFKIYEIYLSKGDCFEFRARPSTNYLVLSLRTPDGEWAMGQTFKYFNELLQPHFVIIGTPGIWEFEFCNHQNVSVHPEFLYRLIDIPPTSPNRIRMVDRLESW